MPNRPNLMPPRSITLWLRIVPDAAQRLHAVESRHRPHRNSYWRRELPAHGQRCAPLPRSWREPRVRSRSHDCRTLSRRSPPSTGTAARRRSAGSRLRTAVPMLASPISSTSTGPSASRARRRSAISVAMRSMPPIVRSSFSVAGVYSEAGPDADQVRVDVVGVEDCEGHGHRDHFERPATLSGCRSLADLLTRSSRPPAPPPPVSRGRGTAPSRRSRRRT